MLPVTRLLIALCIAATQLPAFAGQGTRDFTDVVFAEAGTKKLLLDLHVPAPTGKKPPLVVYIHGGAWSAGDRKELPFKWLTQSGFAVATISYRFTQDAIYPAQIHDCKAAIRWLRAHAGEYGCDASRIAVVGTSAGAHLAVLLGATAGNKQLEGGIGGNLDQSSAIQAVIDFYGPTDFILRSKDQPQFTDVPGSRVYSLLGGAPGEREDLAKLASGAWQISSGDAPLLIFHGAADTTVLPNQAARLLDAARQNHVEATLHVIPGAGHQIDPFLVPEYKALVVEFLNRHLK